MEPGGFMQAELHPEASVTTPANDTLGARIPHGQGAPPEQERAEALAREMVKLTAHISAAEARFLEMLAEFDRDELWVRYGCHCAAQWLTWQCGMGDVAARERVRVARALEKLPKIKAAFRRGEISYSKVREMARIAIPETEESLLNVARHGTAAHMQRLVRKYRRVERLEAAAEAAEQYRRRYVRYRHEDDGMVVIEARLPVEIGEVVMKAIDAAVEVLYQDGVGKKAAAGLKADVPAGTSQGAETESTAPDDLESGSNVSAGTRADGEPGSPLVPERTTTGSEIGPLREHPSARACRSAAEPAGGPSDDASYTSPLWKPHEMPGGGAVIEEFDGDSWPASLGARRADALRLIAEAFLATDNERVDTSAERYQVVVHIDQALLASAAGRSEGGEGQTQNGANAPLLRACELEEGHALAIETARRLACDAGLVGLVDDENGEPLSVGRKTRAISPPLKRALRARDGGCRFPGCGRTRFTHGHHVVHWANGGETKLDHLVTLCSFHHGLVHEGGFSARRTADGEFAFFDPDGERLPETRRLDRGTAETLSHAAEQGRVTLHDLNRDCGLDIDERTAQCRWTGERMDYSIAVGGLIWARDRTREGVRDRATH
jgi:hypothetical protein